MPLVVHVDGYFGGEQVLGVSEIVIRVGFGMMRWAMGGHCLWYVQIIKGNGDFGVGVSVMVNMLGFGVPR